jgi:putative membrane protein
MKGRAALVVMSMCPALAAAHSPSQAAAGGFPVTLAVLLALSVLLYARGLARLWEHVHARRELVWRAVAFSVGLLTLGVALLSPLDLLANRSFAAHMVQHEALMLISAPLLVVGRALPTFLWALPHDARLRVGRATKAIWLRRSWDVLTAPLTAWWLHALALWLWHAPRFFNAALASPLVHDWQHASFLVTALIFWHALLRHAAHAARGMAIVYLFTTTIHTGVLGALLTFARQPLYAGLDQGLGEYFGLTALEDQQLGGLIMWVPGALVYVGVALLLLARWIGNPDAPRRVEAGRGG